VDGNSYVHYLLGLGPMILIVLTWNDPDSLRKVMAERGHQVAAVITGFRFCRGGAQEWFGVTPGTVFQMWFTEHPIRNWRDAERYANEPRFTRWYQEMFLHGVLFHPSQYENLFVSLVTTDEDIDATLAAAADSFRVLATEGS
jgi:glutamate-1-semialdehyde aminotransferase